MTIEYAEQWALATDPTFQHRVESGTLTVALQQFTAPPISGSPKAQDQRIALANACLQHPGYAVEQFVWVLVGRTTFTTREDITDAMIKTGITSQFDLLAQQLFPDVGGP